MTNPFNGLCVVFVSVISLSSNAQDTRAFNQNASRSNHTRGVVLSINSTKGTTHSDSVARNTSFMPSATIQYYSGDWGIGAEIGWFNASPHFNIDEYIRNINGFTDLNVSSTQWKNLFVVAGPSFRKYLGAGAYFGVDLYAGLMKIKSPSFSITDKEAGNLIADFNYARKTTTANENPLFTIKPGIKLEWFPGNGPVGLNIHGSYMNAFGATEISNYYRDLSKVNFNGLSQQEIRAQVVNAPVIETKSKGAISNISFGAGVSIALNHEVKSPRDAASGLATGKRSAPRDAASGQATGKRMYRDHASGLATGKRMSRQTQGATFGEKVNAIFGTITSSASTITTNKSTSPLYNDEGWHAENPMSAIIILVDESTGEAVANTTPEASGEFFFANVPPGDYILKLSSVKNNPLYKGRSQVVIDVINDPVEARRRVEVLKSNKTGDPNAKNKVEHWGDPHENLNGKHIKNWITGETTSIYISLD